MKIAREWHCGLFDRQMLLVWALIVAFDVVFLLTGMWPLIFALTTVPVLTSVDHALWNISDSEDKYFHTGFGYGFRTLFRK